MEEAIIAMRHGQRDEGMSRNQGATGGHAEVPDL